MRAVNLLPRDDRRAGRSRQTNPVAVGGVAAFVAMTAILAALFLVTTAGVADKQERLDAAQAELDATPVPPPAPASASALEQEKGQRVTALSAVLAKRMAWDRVLRELSLVLPEDVWLSTLSAKAPVQAAGGAPTAGFTITGQTYSHDGVARLLARLAVVPHLSNIQLQHSAQAASEGGRQVVEFSIQAVVKAPGAA
jgi:Tfp pilus assembly protein PilN